MSEHGKTSKFPPGFPSQSPQRYTWEGKLQDAAKKLAAMSSRPTDEEIQELLNKIDEIGRPTLREYVLGLIPDANQEITIDLETALSLM